ncbi:exostosin family protein, partial [Candidatus Venteria ishoeyi]|uniref:exostosin family protein n=1 Tax=Candidatus Venteria ishoeyi TaxID=1899563 RepID=UPI000A9C8C0B
MNIIAHNADWQHPAITEQHAFEKAQVLLPTVEGMVYFAFPWATLIDKYNTKQTRDAAQLLEKLQSFIEPLKSYKNVVTVCQHIAMLKFQNIFHKLGITGIFWTHAIKNQTFLPDYPDIHIHPFPLYPVQAVNQTVQTGIDKKYLFSFVGATVNQWYLTDSRHLIVELLGKHPQAYICSREQWHYDSLVYKQQVYGKTIEIEEQTAYQQHSQEFQSIMQQSVLPCVLREVVLIRFV